jgi:PAS domain S-box-containing protein
MAGCGSRGACHGNRDASFDAIVSKSLDGTVRSWNRAAERIFGWSAAEIVGTSIRALIPADRQQEKTARLARPHRSRRQRLTPP